MDKLTEILELGIQAKRQGDYELALKYYEKARKIEPTDNRIYGNTFRVLIGLERFEEALRNLMIIASFNRVDRLIDKDLLDPIANSMLHQFKARFKSPSILYKKGLFKKVKFQPSLIPEAIEKDELLNDLIFRADNLTYYIGHAFIGLNPAIITKHNIPIDSFKNLNNSLLGNPTGNDLRAHKSLGLFLCIGFIFANMNLNNSLKTKNDITVYFLNEKNRLNFNLTNYNIFLQNYYKDNGNNQVEESDVSSIINEIFNKKSEFDTFPANLCETNGYIERNSFNFNYKNADVWQDGKCIFSDNTGGIIVAKLHENELIVEIDNPNINPYIKKKFTFGEISTNIDRIMWSKDMFNTSGIIEKFNPDVSSLFYKNGKLIKVAYTIHDPDILVEFY